MKRMPFWAVLAFLAGCATPINPSAYNPRHIRKIQRLENKKPDKALAKYMFYLELTRFATNAHAGLEQPDEPLSFHQSSLKRQVAALSKNLPASPTPLGIPAIYQDHIESLTLAWQGVARAYLVKGDWLRAERNAQNAIELIKLKSILPVAAAEYVKSSYEGLKTIYDRTGQVGMSYSAQLNIELLEEYLKSEQAKDDRALAAKISNESSIMVSKCNRLVAAVNQATMNEMGNTLTMMASMTALTAQAQALDQYEAALGGMVTPQLLQMQTQLMMNMMTFVETQVEFAMAEPTTLASELASSLNPMLNAYMVEQLVDPRRGVDPYSPYKRFCSNVHSATPDEALKSEADVIAQRVDRLKLVRDKGAEKKTREEVAEFGGEFTVFHNKAIKIQAIALSAAH